MKNSMKALLSTFVVAAVMSSPVFAEEKHNHNDKNQSMGGGMMMEHMHMMAEQDKLSEDNQQ